MMHLDHDLTPEMPVYRYLPLESFIAFVETGRTVLTNINQWDDPWEAILGKVPTIDEKGRPSPPLYSFHQDIFGQSWTLLDESDAMWRIYSPRGRGLQIKTLVGRFALVGGVDRSHVGKIAYFENKEELLELANERTSSFDQALVKRGAFRHEREIRYLTNGQFLQNRVGVSEPRVALPLDPVAFIEAVTVDPRAEDWYLDAVVAYAVRAKLHCIPTRSRLYEPEPERTIGFSRRWVPVDDKS